MFIAIIRPNNMSTVGLIEVSRSNILSNLINGDSSFWENLSAELEAHLKVEQTSGDDLRANLCWFLRAICDTRCSFIDSFCLIKSGDYYDAWCELEKVEIGLKSIIRNPFLSIEEFQIHDLLGLTQAWQMLYPYKWFISPGILYRTVKCGICSANITPWEGCDHEPGLVYNGVQCHRTIVDCELLEVSLVQNPVQKYSAIHTTKDDNGNEVEIFDYDLVRFVSDRVASPFDQFRVVETRAFHPHDLFSERNREGPCPCESGRRYSDCCWEKRGVLRPHMEIIFEKMPAENLPNVELVGYGDKSGAAARRSTEKSSVVRIL